MIVHAAKSVQDASMNNLHVYFVGKVKVLTNEVRKLHYNDFKKFPWAEIEGTTRDPKQPSKFPTHNVNTVSTYYISLLIVLFFAMEFHHSIGINIPPKSG